jgi:hypothetical protein
MAGFPLTDRIKLLGLDITNDIGDMDQTFIPILEKIEKIIKFWERFNLSLPGRLSVMKTLLIPQLNYLGCILIPPPEVLSRLQNAIDNFVIKNITFASSRRYLPPENGGLGLFDLENF